MTFHTKTTFHVLAARSHVWKSIESSFQRRSQFCLTSGALQMSFVPVKPTHVAEA